MTTLEHQIVISDRVLARWFLEAAPGALRGAGLLYSPRAWWFVATRYLRLRFGNDLVTPHARSLMQQRPSYRLAMLPLLAAALGAMGGGGAFPALSKAERLGIGSPRSGRPTAQRSVGAPTHRYSHAATWRRWTHATLAGLSAPGDVRDVSAAIAKRERKAVIRLAERASRAARIVV